MPRAQQPLLTKVPGRSPLVETRNAGDSLPWRVIVQFPEGTYTNVQVTDQLMPDMTCRSIVGGQDVDGIAPVFTGGDALLCVGRQPLTDQDAQACALTNTAPGITVPAGSMMNIRIQITNNGDQDLGSIQVTDSTIPAGNLTCDSTYVARGETTYCWAQLPAPPIGQQHHNVATVTAQGQQNGATVTGSDQAYAISDMDYISPVKSARWRDANRDGQLSQGDTILYSIWGPVVGTVSDITVSDPALPGLQCSIDPVITDGWFYCWGERPATTAELTSCNISNTATFTWQRSNGTRSSTTAESVANGVCVDAKKTHTYADTNGSGFLDAGDTISYVVEGTAIPPSGGALEDLKVTDPMLPGLQCTFLGRGVYGSYLQTRDFRPGRLQISYRCTGSVTLTAAQIQGCSVNNTATISYTPVVYGPQESYMRATTTGVNSTTVTDTLREPEVACERPAVSIEKRINGQDADELPGPKVAAGSDMAVVFHVTNTGNAVLGQVRVSDDTIAASAIRCPADALAVGASMDCTATLRAPASGTHTNTGTVTAVGPSGGQVSSSDPANATAVDPSQLPPTTPPTSTPPTSQPPASTPPAVPGGPGDTPGDTQRPGGAPGDPSDPQDPGSLSDTGAPWSFGLLVAGLSAMTVGAGLVLRRR